MGSCFSSDSSNGGGGGSSIGKSRSSRNSTAKVVLPDGLLREYAGAVTAHQVLSDHHDDDSSSHFICSSDELFYDAEIQALGPRESLQLGQLYFLLPHSKLGRRLSGSDMAALAVKASSALEAAAAGKEKDDRRSGIRIQVMPLSDDRAYIYLMEGGGGAADHVLETINVLTILPYIKTMSSSSMSSSNYTKRLDSAAANSLLRNLASPQNMIRKKLSAIEELAE